MVASTHGGQYPWWPVPMLHAAQWAQFRKTINLCVGTKDIQAAKEEVSKHVPVPINVHHFPIHITQDCRTQSWKLFFYTVFSRCSHTRVYVYIMYWGHVVSLCSRLVGHTNLITEERALGAGLVWTALKQERSRWVTHNCKSYNASPHTNFVLQATNMKGLGMRLVNTCIKQWRSQREQLR